MPRYLVDLNNCKYHIGAARAYTDVASSTDLQKQASLHVLTWVEDQEGPIWVMTLKINEVPFGVGRGAKKGSAKEEAARKALIQLGLLSESE
ncbi:hypothetical protein GY45DRAFT_1367646 [Cubamyces sp. BRFM 1775]|nr:hypothetical protein GY45DRAFT_1367646 [Cubamyces sp. BRFM 1775]